MRGFRQVSACSARPGFSQRCTFWTELTGFPPGDARLGCKNGDFCSRFYSLLRSRCGESIIFCSEITNTWCLSDLQINEIKTRRQQPTASPAVPLCKIVFSSVLTFCQGIYCCRTKIHHGTSVLTVSILCFCLFWLWVCCFVWSFCFVNELMRERDERINRFQNPRFSAQRQTCLNCDPAPILDAIAKTDCKTAHLWIFKADGNKLINKCHKDNVRYTK